MTAVPDPNLWANTATLTWENRLLVRLSLQAKELEIRARKSSELSPAAGKTLATLSSLYWRRQATEADGVAGGLVDQTADASRLQFAVVDHGNRDNGIQRIQLSGRSSKILG